MPTIDAPPKWLEKVLSEHQPADDTLEICSCSYGNLDARHRPKKFVTYSHEHQAAEVHKALGESIASLFQGGV